MNKILLVNDFNRKTLTIKTFCASFLWLEGSFLTYLLFFKYEIRLTDRTGTFFKISNIIDIKPVYLSTDMTSFHLRPFSNTSGSWNYDDEPALLASKLKTTETTNTTFDDLVDDEQMTAGSIECRFCIRSSIKKFTVYCEMFFYYKKCQESNNSWDFSR